MCGVGSPVSSTAASVGGTLIFDWNPGRTRTQQRPCVSDHKTTKPNILHTHRRFLEYSLSASLMLTAIGMITGLRDFNSMFGVFVLSFTTMFLGLITEMLSRPASPDKWEGSYGWRMFPHLIGWVPYIAAWCIVLGNFLRQIADLPQEQQDRIPPFVPWAIYGTAVVFTSFSFVQVRYQFTAPKHYWRSEIWYCVLSLFAKTYLGSLLYWNVLLAGSFDEAISPQAGEMASG